MTQQTIAGTGQASFPTRIDRILERLAAWLSRYSIDTLRISLGFVFLGFGVLKFFPGMSPAQDMAIRTVETLSFGVVSGLSALFLTAVMECFIGISLVTGRMLRTGLMVLAAALVGILSPVFLFFGELFPDGPTLAAQYVLKDIVLASAGLVVGAKALGARLTRPIRT
ncbi:MAG: DoxX family protein [Acidimicrobiia bacterium]